MADIILTWQNNVHFIAEDDSNNSISIDGSPQIGGQNQGTRPMMMVLMGLASCASMDIVSILNKSKQSISYFKVEVNARRHHEIPRVFTDIHLNFILQGTLDEKKVQRAIKLSVEKYCSVASMLNKTANITYSTHIIGDKHL